MNALERFHWWFSGEVAEIIEEKYDDTEDAILFPLFSAILTLGSFYTAAQIFSNGGLIAVLLAGLMSLFGLFLTILLIVNLAASVRYTREWTQSTRRFEEAE